MLVNGYAASCACLKGRCHCAKLIGVSWCHATWPQVFHRCFTGVPHLIFVLQLDGSLSFTCDSQALPNHSVGRSQQIWAARRSAMLILLLGGDFGDWIVAKQLSVCNCPQPISGSSAKGRQDSQNLSQSVLHRNTPPLVDHTVIHEISKNGPILEAEKNFS